jgi:hypothetical protein
MTLGLFATTRYLIVLLLCGAAYLVGAASLRRLAFANLAERLFVCTGFGLGVISHLILLIGLLGWLTLSGVISIIAFSALAALIFLRISTGALPTGTYLSTTPRWKVIAVICGLLAIGFVWAPVLRLPLYPPTDFDVTMYHLAGVKMWVRAHAIIPTPFLRGQVFPHTAHALFAALMVATDDITAQMLSLAAVVLVAVGLFGWGSRVQGISCGIVAIALWLASPAVLSMSGVASYHTLASLFTFGAVFSLANYATGKQTLWLFVAAGFIGFAESSWSLTIYFIPVFAAATLYFALKERRLLPVYAVAAGLLLGWGPSLVRAFVYTGNPTYPLFTTLFGTGPWWTSRDVIWLANDIHRIGVPRTFVNFITLPYLLFAHPEKFQSPVSYCLALFALLPLVAFRSIADRYVRSLAVILVYYIGCWFVFGQVMRYLLPIIPLLCVVTAIAMSWLIQRTLLLPGKVVFVLLVAAFLGLVVPDILFARKEIARLGPIPLTTQQRMTYIGARIPSYPALIVANAEPAPIYSLGGNNGAYYSEGLFLGDWFGPGRYTRVLDAARSGRSLYETLHSLGARYFLLNLWQGYVPALPYDDPEFRQRFELLFADRSAELYRISDSPLTAPTVRTNLLRNAGFDDLLNGSPVVWDRNKAPKVGAPPGGAASGSSAVSVDKVNTFSQAVLISPAVSYELQLKAEAGAQENKFRIQVNWIDRQNKICDVFIRIFAADASWKSYSAQMTAPSCAYAAMVYATGHTDSPVWLDSFSFQRAQ